MSLKYGDNIPSDPDCDFVSKGLLPRMVADDGSDTLEIDPDPGEFSTKGKLFLSSRKDDYVADLNANNLQNCTVDDTFCTAKQLLRMPIELLSGIGHCTGPYFTNEAGIYPDGYFGLVEGGHPSIVPSVGTYSGTTYTIGMDYAGESWRLTEYTWTDFGASQNTLESGTVDIDGTVTTTPTLFSGVSLTGGGTNHNGAIRGRLEVQCDGIWPEPPDRPF